MRYIQQFNELNPSTQLHLTILGLACIGCFAFYMYMWMKD